MLYIEKDDSRSKLTDLFNLALLLLRPLEKDLGVKDEGGPNADNGMGDVRSWTLTSGRATKLVWKESSRRGVEMAIIAWPEMVANWRLI